MRLIFILFFLGSLLNFIFTFFLIKKARYFNLIDNPGFRKIHEKSIPVVGGLGIVLTFLSLILFNYFSNNILNLFINFLQIEQIFAIIIGTFIIVVSGLMDDSFGLSPFSSINSLIDLSNSGPLI